MRRDLRLYLDGKRVDLSDNTSILMTYQMTDLVKPSAIKNNFSKTVTLEGTKMNNQIFGYIYRFDFTVPDGNGYNPNLRVPFELYSNSDLLESGYIKLNKVIREGYTVKYEINLFGGLGDFFYSLSADQDGEELELSDLNYFGGGDNELDLKVNKTLVKNNFNQGWTYQVADKNQFIRFVPAKNGVYDNFANDKAVILNSTSGDNYFPKTVTEEGVTYTTNNGYLYADLGGDFDEWDVGDLRSYKQRPSVRMNKLMETIFSSSGYEVIKDTDFFCEANPYWSKSVMVLPLASTNTEDGGGESTASGSLWTDLTVPLSPKIGYLPGGSTVESSSGYTKISGTTITTDQDTIKVSKFNANASLTVQYTTNIQFFFVSTTGTPSTGIYLGTTFNGNVYKQHIDVYARVVTANSHIELGRSNTYRLNGHQEKYLVDDGAEVINYMGYFEYKGTQFQYRVSNGGTIQRLFPFVIEVNGIGNEDLKIEVVAKWVKGEGEYCDIGTAYLQGSQFGGDLERVKGYVVFKTDQATSPVKVTWSPSEPSTNMTLTKKGLLSTGKSPLDYMLSYLKPFNFYWLKNKYDKKVEILTINKFYTGEVVDWTERIDMSKKTEIVPYTSEYQYYNLEWPEHDDYLNEKYTNKYKKQYGMKRLNTGYQFNSETEDFFDENVFQNVIDLQDRSKFNVSLMTQTGSKLVPYPLIGNDITVKYFKSGDTKTTLDKTFSSANDNLQSPTYWHNLNYYDNKILPTFFSKDADTKSLSDIESSLLFYNGMQSDKHSGHLKITDDCAAMYAYAGKPCHLIIDKNNSNKDVWGVGESDLLERIDSLPFFSRAYRNSQNLVTESWNLGVPRENYTLEAETDESTIYSNYWASYLNDLYDKHSRKLTAYFNLRGLVVDYQLLRKWVYLNNSLYRINKISDYDVSDDEKPVKVELIRINDTQAYKCKKY